MPYVSDFSYGDYNYNMKSKYYLIALLTILITLCSTIFLFGCNEKEDNIETFNITYSTNYGGRIDGEANQTVKKGDCGSEVTAQAWEEGYYFEKWSDGVEEATRKEENVTENKRIEAIFKIMEFTVEYQSGDGGYVKGGTIIRGIQYGADLNEIVEAIPNEGYEFDVWSDGVTTATRQEKNIISDKQLCAYFELKHVKVSYIAESNGKIEGVAEQTVTYGSATETVTAVPNEGYEFDVWSDGITSATRQDTNLTSDKQISAYFKLKHVTVTYYAGVNGKIQGSTQQSVAYGSETELVTAIPNEGYEFDVWSDGVTTARRQEKNITSNKQIFANFKLKHVQVTYIAEFNGKIEGVAEQSVIYGRQTEWVTAVPDEGYKFIGWSDGYKTETRRDYYCTKDIQITAYFEIIKRTFKLNYNMVTKDAVEEVELTYFETDKVTLPVPEKDKFTFCGWYQDKLQVSDENGIIIAGDKVFENSLNKLHAKWQAHETFTYKILMIYITDVQAMLPTQQHGNPTGETVAVNYQISDIERQVYHNLTIKLEETLEDMLDGLVDFVVDEYFTTQAIGTESITQDSGGNVKIWPWNIPEITKERREQYQSILTTLNFNEYNHLFHSAAGAATEKYGTIYFESSVNRINIEDLLDLNSCYWETALGAYIHELSHTIEMRKDFYSFHSAAVSHLIVKEGMQELEAYKLYYLSEIEIEGQKVGIPYDFWKEDLENPYIDRF